MEDAEDIEFNELEHDKLISAVSKLDKTQHIKVPTRNEPTHLTSEFNLIKNTKLDLKNVVKVLQNTPQHVQIGKKLSKTQDTAKILAKPLEKPVAQRIKRSTGYEETKKKIGRWDPVVARSRTVDYVSFPLKHTGTKLQPTDEFLTKFKTKSPLELELEEVDPTPITEDVDEEEKSYPMTYEEMVQHRQHLAKMRAQQSFREAKAKRQSKIKSKKYHRILKKEKLKQQIKEFEQLQQTDPEEALRKLDSLEKTRALERHTLRHRNTGKWAKNLQVRAKYDKEVRQQLAEQLSISRGLTQKTNVDESSDDEVDNDVIPDMSLSIDPDNPWKLTGDKSKVNDEFNFGYKKYLKDKMYKRVASDSDEESSVLVEDSTNVVDGDVEVDASCDVQAGSLDDLILQLGQNQSKTVKNAKKSILGDNNKIDSKKAKANDKNDVKSQKTVKTEENNKQVFKNNAKEAINKFKPINNENKLTSTTNWTVEVINKSDTDIIDAFDDLESKLSNKVKRKLRSMKRELAKLEKTPTETRKETEEDKDNLEYLKLKPDRVKAVIDEELIETNNKKPAENTKITTKPIKLADANATEGLKVDVTKFTHAKPKHLNSALPDDIFDQFDDQIVPRVNIEETFEDDELVASFRQEKDDESKVVEANDELPGWGTWVGKGVKAPRKRKNRFITKLAPKVPRKDENKGDVIIKEFKNPKISAHKVSDVPFPFNSVKDFEASIRAPIGDTFVPQKAFKKLIRPSVITKAGTIINPIDEDELLVPKNRNFGNANVINLLGNK